MAGKIGLLCIRQIENIRNRRYIMAVKTLDKTYIYIFLVILSIWIYVKQKTEALKIFCDE